ncbi:hypothetical protein Dimus_012205 [Dionaea muscipula]
MVARSPPKQKNQLMVAPLSPTLIRETVKKVDQCMARLQELQNTVTGGGSSKADSRITLSPPRNMGHFKSSVRCKQDSLRIRGGSTARKSPAGKLPSSATTVEWHRMSLPAMLVRETMAEILQASKSAREVFETMSDPPKTPVTMKLDSPDHPENTGFHGRRKREKQQQHLFRIIQSESNTPSSHRRARARARSRINFKVSPPLALALGKENGYYPIRANKVSPRNRPPWVKKTVLFPNPLFHSSPTSKQQKFCRTRSPVIVTKKSGQTPHKFLIKSPSSSTSTKFQVKIKSPVVVTVSSPSKRRSPMKVLSTASKLRRSLSPSRLANRLVSPLKSRMSVQKKNEHKMVSGLKHRPTVMMPMVGSLARRI